MLRITLYKDTILSNKYKEVFSLGIKTGETESIFEKYLNTHVKRQIPDIENTYYENSGELVFDYNLVVGNYEDNIYEFNYLKIEEYENSVLRLKRYCFINKIEIKNELVYLEYEEDIWHSYSHNIKAFTNSYLCRSRFTDYSLINIDWKKIIAKYSSNKPILYNSILDNHGQYNLILELQLYNLDTTGAITDRENYTVASLVHIVSPSDYYTFILGPGFIYDILNKIIKNQAGGLIDGKHYEVGDVFLVPADFEVIQGTHRVDFRLLVNGTEITAFTKLDNTGDTFEDGYEFTIQNNYKNIAIGNFSTQIELLNLGVDFTAKIKYFINEYNFKIQLECQNQILDITDDYRIEPPFLSLLSEEVSQKNLSRMSTVMKNIFSMISSGLNILDTGDSWIQNLQGGIISGILGKVGGMTSSAKSMSSGKYSAMKEVVNIAESYWNIKVANAPIFSSSQGKFTNSLNFCNSYYGLLLFSIDSINDDFVKDYTNNFGYEVYKFVNGIIQNLDLENPSRFETYSCNYNILKFDYCCLYGSFPLEIAHKLEEIFEKGVKIWYNHQMQPDYYVV